jgi:triphosphatase
MGFAAREQEWQFTASAPEAIHAWLRREALPSGDVEERPAVELLDTYYDTPDWMIHRAGYALRIRRAGNTHEATLKSLRSDGAAPFVDRREISEPLPEADPRLLSSAKGDVGARVRALAGPRPLAPLFEVRTQRELYALRADGTDAAEIAVDDSRFAAPGKPEHAATRVEVECLHGSPETVQPWVETLRTTTSLEPSRTSKYQLGLATAGLTPPSSLSLGTIDIDPSMTVREAAFATLRRHLQAVIEHEPGTRADDGPEDLHAMRVAARRLDAAVRVYGDHVPQALRRFRPSLKRLMRALGVIRDLHLQLVHLARVSGDLPETQRHALHPLRDRIESERRRARARMLRALDSAALQKMFAVWVRHLRSPPSTQPEATQVQLETFANDVVARHHKKLRKRTKRLTRTPTAEELHEIRRRTKRLRYVVEGFCALYGKSANRFLRAVTRFQDVLGEYQDAHVRIARLTRLAADSGSKLPGETLFAMGQLAERDSRLTHRLQKRIPKVYRHVRRKRWPPQPR